MPELARELGEFGYDFDYYDFMDCYGGLEEGIMCIYEDLKRKETRKGIIDFLHDVAEYGDVFEDRIKAAKLYRKVMTL